MRTSWLLSSIHKGVKLVKYFFRVIQAIKNLIDSICLGIQESFDGSILLGFEGGKAFYWLEHLQFLGYLNV